MPTRDAEAVVLRQYSLSEADRIIVLFTREYGKLRAVAAGAKRPRSRIGGCLEPVNHIRLHYYLKEGGDLARILQCETIHSYLGREVSLQRLYAFTYVVEIVQEITQENNAHPLLFRLLLATLRAAEKQGVNEPLLGYFEYWALRLSGFLGDYDYCSACGKCVRDEGFYARKEDGLGRCSRCAGNSGIRVGSSGLRLLQIMFKSPPEAFAAVSSAGDELRALRALSQRLLEFHLEKRLKSYQNLQAILRSV